MHYLYTDGGSRGNPGNSACACFLFDNEMKLLALDAKFLNTATNNFAEYNALILGLKLAQKLGIEELTCRLDSELAVKQLKGEYKVKDENIAKFHAEIMMMAMGFKSIQFVHVPREENKFADKLVNIILDAVESSN